MNSSVTRETFGQWMNIARRAESRGDKELAASAAQRALEIYADNRAFFDKTYVAGDNAATMALACEAARLLIQRNS